MQRFLELSASVPSLRIRGPGFRWPVHRNSENKMNKKCFTYKAKEDSWCGYFSSNPHEFHTTEAGRHTRFFIKGHDLPDLKGDGVSAQNLKINLFKRGVRWSWGLYTLKSNVFIICYQFWRGLIKPHSKWVKKTICSIPIFIF